MPRAESLTTVQRAMLEVAARSLTRLQNDLTGFAVDPLIQDGNLVSARVLVDVNRKDGRDRLAGANESAKYLFDEIASVLRDSSGNENGILLND